MKQSKEQPSERLQQITDDELSAVAGGVDAVKGKCLRWEDFKKMRNQVKISSLDTMDPSTMALTEIVGFSGSFG